VYENATEEAAAKAEALETLRCLPPSFRTGAPAQRQDDDDDPEGAQSEADRAQSAADRAAEAVAAGACTLARFRRGQRSAALSPEPPTPRFARAYGRRTGSHKLLHAIGGGEDAPPRLPGSTVAPPFLISAAFEDALANGAEGARDPATGSATGFAGRF
jgi:hypothetical protein